MAALFGTIIAGLKGTGLAGWLSGGGALLSTASAIAEGNAQKAAANHAALQLDAQAKTERATAQRDMLEEQRRKRIIMSRARAVGAAGGGGQDIDLLSDIEEEGTQRALTAMWEGEERAKGREAQASGMRFEGTRRKRAGVIRGATTLLSGGASWLDTYG